MGFGISPPSQPVPQPTNLGFNFGLPSTAVTSQPQPPPQVQNSFGMDMLGSNTQPFSQPTITPTTNQANFGFKPIINTNPNKFLGY